MGFLWDFYRFFIGFKWDLYGIFIGFLLDLHGIYMDMMINLKETHGKLGYYSDITQIISNYIPTWLFQEAPRSKSPSGCLTR